MQYFLASPIIFDHKYTEYRNRITGLFQCLCKNGKEAETDQQHQEISHTSNPNFTYIPLYMLKSSLIIYVIQLSDRVYNVTFPAYDIYSPRRSRREYIS